MSFPPGDFLRDTRVHPLPDAPGCYRAKLPPAWNILYLFGGVTMAAAASAAQAACSQRDFRLLSVTANFLAPVKAGEVTLKTRPLRQGKGSEVWAVELSQGGAQPALHLVATLGPESETDTRLVDLTCPDVPSPSDVPSVEARPGSRSALIPYFHNVETKPIPTDHPAVPAGKARWFGWQRLRHCPRGEDGLLDPLAYIPAADMIGPALRIARGPGASKIMLISLEISMHFYARTMSTWLLQDTQIRQADHGYVSGSVNLWDEERRLLAHALQRAIMRPRNW